MLRPDTLALTTLLALLTAVGPVSVDLYLPSLPEIGRVLSAPESQVQLTISGYLIGFASGQMIYGPISDSYGRRPVLLVALVIFCIATLICAVTPTIETLIAARIVQAIGGAGAIVLARAIVRDLYDGARAGRELSLMGSIMGVTPIIAPLIGGFIQETAGWRADFIFIFAVGLIATILTWRLLPETRRVESREALSLQSLMASYRIILGNGGFIANLVLVSTSYAGLFVWISSSSFIMQDIYRLTPLYFGLVFATASAGFVTGTIIAARIVGRIGLDRTLGVGAVAMAFAGLALAGGITFLPGYAFAVTVPVSIYLAGFGIAMPQGFAGALHPFPERAGAASSLIGGVQQTAGAVAGVITGHALTGTPWPLAVGLLILGWITLAVWATTRGVRNDHAARP